jgi:hypothetical protein
VSRGTARTKEGSRRSYRLAMTRAPITEG